VIVGGDGGGRWTGGFFRGMLRAPVVSMFVSQRLRGLATKIKQEDLVTVAELVEAGTVTPVIDRTYPLIDAPDAIRYLEQGHAGGKIVITV
jgi:NADPH:quinone reductase-like Zn-dependent oxidoreductase